MTIRVCDRANRQAVIGKDAVRMVEWIRVEARWLI